MKKLEVIGGLAWMSAGALFFAGSIAMGLGSLSEPGPGFFPLLMSGCLMTFSLVHVLSCLWSGRPSLSEGETRFWPDREGIRKVVLINLLLLLFVFALNLLGFVLTTFLFMFFLLRFVEPQKWSTVLLITGLSTGLSYLVFRVWLRASLPTGFLGF